LIQKIRRNYTALSSLFIRIAPCKNALEVTLNSFTVIRVMTTRSCETSSGTQASLVSGSSELLTRSASNPGDLASGPIVLGAAANSFPLSVTHSCHGKHITNTKLTQNRHVPDTYGFSKRPEKHAIDTKNTQKNKILKFGSITASPATEEREPTSFGLWCFKPWASLKDTWALVLPHVTLAGIIRQKTPGKPHYPQKATWWRRISFAHLLSTAAAVRFFSKNSTIRSSHISRPYYTLWFFPFTMPCLSALIITQCTLRV
jgi:hypothetical protein